MRRACVNEFCINAFDMRVDGVETDEVRLRYFLVWLSADQVAENFTFALRERLLQRGIEAPEG